MKVPFGRSIRLSGARRASRPRHPGDIDGDVPVQDLVHTRLAASAAAGRARVRRRPGTPERCRGGQGAGRRSTPVSRGARGHQSKRPGARPGHGGARHPPTACVPAGSRGAGALRRASPERAPIALSAP